MATGSTGRLTSLEAFREECALVIEELRKERRPPLWDDALNAAAAAVRGMLVGEVEASSMLAAVVDDIYTRAAFVFSEESQIRKVAEECCELAAAINRLQNGTGDLQAVINEAADVAFILPQLVRITGELAIAGAIARARAKFVRRLEVLERNGVRNSREPVA